MKLVTALALLLLTAPLYAQDREERQKETGEMMGDAVTQPLADINLKRKGVPAILQAVRDKPYDMTGIRTCREIIAEVTKLDAALGDDFDKIEVNTRDRKRKEGAAGVTRGIISGLIPFRALIREVSGARASDQDYREAVYAGVVRRSYLKGLGTARRCRAPGRPMTAMESAQEAASDLLAEEPKPDDKK
jgi:hypothetical protein